MIQCIYLSYDSGDTEKIQNSVSEFQTPVRVAKTLLGPCTLIVIITIIYQVGVTSVEQYVLRNCANLCIKKTRGLPLK